MRTITEDQVTELNRIAGKIWAWRTVLKEGMPIYPRPDLISDLHESERALDKITGVDELTY